MEIVRKLSPVMAVNAVIDDRRQVTFLNYGEIEPSHLEAVDFLRAYVEIAVPQKFSAVVTSAGGYPLDKIYYQDDQSIAVIPDGPYVVPVCAD